MPEVGERLREAIADLAFTAREWRAAIGMVATDQPDPLARLASVVRELQEPGELRPPKCPPDYLKLWSQYCQGEDVDLSPRALRSLCWDPAVALDDRFPAALSRLEKLRPRDLQALVHSLHLAWSRVVAASDLRRIVETALRDYEGPHQLLKRWGANLDQVVGADGPTSIARHMISHSLPLDDVLGHHRIEPTSAFARMALRNAVRLCRSQWNSSPTRLPYCLDHLLQSPHWDLSEFKEVIGEVIFDATFEMPQAQNRLKALILKDPRLGDVRLPHRRPHWAAVDEAARRRFVEWLSKDDIVFFFEHTLPKGSDPHGRKQFWLRYVSQIRQSRTLLNAEDRARLRAVLDQDAVAKVSVGAIDENTSAFLLDFGSLRVIEFSRSGNACYIYSSSVFGRLIPDIWAPQVFRHSSLKRSSDCLARIIHKPGWEREMGNLLVRAGVIANR
jgi:hypothetical protein